MNTAAPISTLQPAASFAEITGLMAALPPLPAVPEGFTGPAELGGWADCAIWLGQAQNRSPPRLNRPRLALFAAPHGHQGDIDMASRLAPWQSGTTATARLLATQTEVDLQLYEMASSAPTGDMTQGPALTEAAAAHAMAYGMMAAEPGLDLLMLSTIDDEATGAQASAEAVIAALTKTEPASETARQALTANRAHLTDPLTILAILGGYESGAIFGAILAARLAKMPVLLEGLPALAAALTLAKLGGTQARDLLAHVRAIDVPENLLPLFGFMRRCPALSVPPDDGRAAAAALPVLRALAQQ